MSQREALKRRTPVPHLGSQQTLRATVRGGFGGDDRESFLKTTEYFANDGKSMCEVIIARIENNVAGVSSCDEIFAEVAGCRYAKLESENERAVTVLPIIQCRVSRGRYTNTFSDFMNDAARQMKEKPPTTFLIFDPLGSDIEYDYALSIWALDVIRCIALSFRNEVLFTLLASRRWVYWRTRRRIRFRYCT